MGMVQSMDFVSGAPGPSSSTNITVQVEIISW